MAEVDLYEAMSTCRAVRRLRPDPIPDAVLERVLQAAAWAPTGGNVQPWRVIAVRDPALREKIGALYLEVWSGYAEQSRRALAALDAVRRERAEKMLEAGDQLAANFGRTPVLLVFCFNPEQMAITDAGLGRPSVVGGASLYPAVQNALLACRAEGLGCVLTTLLCMKERELRELLAIPQPWATGACVPIGYPERRGHGPLSRRPVDKLAFADRFGAPLSPAR